jgi:hypothetical protein
MGWDGIEWIGMVWYGMEWYSRIVWDGKDWMYSLISKKLSD